MKEYKIDRTGYPLLFIPSGHFYVHVIPITKIQFEKFLSYPGGVSDPTFYADIVHQSVNPRISPSDITKDTWRGLFATGVTPKEAMAFGDWLGTYELPMVEEWRECYSYLAAKDPSKVLAQILSDENLNQFAKITLQWIIAQNPSAQILEITLLKGGFLDWVKTNDARAIWGGLGNPSSNNNFSSRIIDPLIDSPIPPIRYDYNLRIKDFGFRLLSKHDEN